MHSAQELVANIESLAALPTVYYRVREQLESPDGTIGEVARLVESDPAITTGVLRLVNSAFYGFSRKIESVKRAIPILGMRQTHDLVLAMSVSAVFDGIRPQKLDMKHYWQSCMLTALAARELAYLACGLASERMFVIGLLADIGHPVMYQTVPELALEARTVADASGEPLFEAERRIVGCDYAEVGATLVDTWQLPTRFAEVIGAQISPRLGGDRMQEAEVLHVAQIISDADRRGEASDRALARVDPRIWDDLGIGATHFVSVREASEMNLSSCTAMFFPSAA